MTVELDDLTDRLERQVAHISGAPDLGDVHDRARALRRRHRLVTAGTTAALVVAVAVGALAWRSSGGDAPTLDVGGDVPPSTATTTTGDTLTRETPWGTLTVRTGDHIDSLGFEDVPEDCAPGVFVETVFEPTAGGGSSRTVGYFEVTPDAGPRGVTIAETLAIADVPGTRGTGRVVLTVAVGAASGTYRATFADGATDTTTAVGGSLVFVSASHDPSASTPGSELDLERLAEDGSVAERWSFDELTALSDSMQFRGRRLLEILIAADQEVTPGRVCQMVSTASERDGD